MDDTQALHLAREALQQGNKAAARTLLAQVVKHNPRSEVGWLLLSAAVDDPAEEQDCLKRVLAVNPGNQVAQQHLDSLTQQTQLPPLPQEPTPEPTPPSPAYCPHCGKRLPSRAVTFCTDCGYDLLTGRVRHTPEPGPRIPQQTTAVHPVPVGPTTPPAVRRSWFERHLWLVIAGVCVAGLLVCFVGPLLLGSSQTDLPGSTGCERQATIEFLGKIESVALRVSNATDAYGDGSRESSAKLAARLRELLKELTALPTSCREMEEVKWTYVKAVQLTAHGSDLCATGRTDEGIAEILEGALVMEDAKKAVVALRDAVR